MKRTDKMGKLGKSGKSKSRAGMGRDADGTPRVSLNRLAKLSGYSVATVVAKRKQGYSDEEIVTQGLERQEKQAGGGTGASSVGSTKNPPLSFPSRPLPPPPSIPPPPTPRTSANPNDSDSGESLDPVDTPAETYSQAALREKIAMANKREMEELVMRGMLVQAEEVATLWARIGGQIRDELLAIPDRVSIRLDQRPYREIREILMAEIRRVLMGISDGVAAEGRQGVQDMNDDDTVHTSPTQSDSPTYQSI